MSEAILPAQSPLPVRSEFGFSINQRVRIAFGVPQYGGQVGRVSAFGDGVIAVTLGEEDSGSEIVTYWFDPSAVIKT